MFFNEDGKNARADVNMEQVAGSLRELQEEVEVLEEVVHDMVFMMRQKEKQGRRDGGSKLSQRKLLPKGCHGGLRPNKGRSDQEATKECRSITNKHSDNHRSYKELRAVPAEHTIFDNLATIGAMVCTLAEETQTR